MLKHYQLIQLFFFIFLLNLYHYLCSLDCGGGTLLSSRSYCNLCVLCSLLLSCSASSGSGGALVFGNTLIPVVSEHAGSLLLSTHSSPEVADLGFPIDSCLFINCTTSLSGERVRSIVDVFGLLKR